MIQKIRNQINQYFVGKDEVVENVLICLLAGGHVLLEDTPGVGKTTLAKALSQTIQCSFGRIQFTPDTLPGDVVGFSVYNMKKNEFEYREGAVMHQMILADEINRTSPKTQASLLEAMAEGQVTVDGTVYPLPQPFMVLATQNPIEFIGTYPLPEAQMDRFMMRLSIGYPVMEEEALMLRNLLEDKKIEDLEPVATTADIIALKEKTKAVHISDELIQYMIQIVTLTRKDHRFAMGASPRALISLAKASQAKAFLEGRDYVKPDDVRAVVVNVLHHRIVPTSETKARKENLDVLILELVSQVRVPVR